MYIFAYSVFISLVSYMRIQLIANTRGYTHTHAHTRKHTHPRTLFLSLSLSLSPHIYACIYILA